MQRSSIAEYEIISLLQTDIYRYIRGSNTDALYDPRIRRETSRSSDIRLIDSCYLSMYFTIVFLFFTC
jgi:hypothetical protein